MVALMPTASAMRLLGKILVGLCLLAVLLWRLDVHAIGGALARYRWPALLGALALMTASWPLAAARWKLFAQRFRFAYLLELSMIGQFYAVLLPGPLAGEVVKAYRIAKGNADAERLAASVAMDRIVGTISLLLVAASGLLLSHRELPSGLVPVFAASIGVLLASLFALQVGLVRKLATSCIGMLERTRLARIAASLHRAVDAWCEFGRDVPRLLLSLVLGIIFQLLSIGIMALLAANLEIAVPLADWAWISGFVSIVIMIPISVGGIGLREGALMGCLGYLGVPGETAMALSLGMFAVAVYGAVIGGILELIRHANPSRQREAG